MQCLLCLAGNIIVDEHIPLTILPAECYIDTVGKGRSLIYIQNSGCVVQVSFLIIVNV